MKKIEKSIDLGGRKLTLQTGVLAEQASGAVLAQYGETVVLATVVSAPLKVDLGYFPLTVEYQERLYAGGRIKGSRWVKREGRPTDEEILSARLIDRSIRPLFPETYKGKDVQVMITVLSVDFENDPSVLAAIAASAAIAISPIPWKGPVGAVRVGKKGATFSTNPLNSEMAESEMDLVVSATKDAVLMIEAGASEVDEKAVLGAIEHGQKDIKKIIEVIEDLVKDAGKQKESAGEELATPALKGKVKKLLEDKTEDLIKVMASHEGGAELEEIKNAIIQELSEEPAAAVALVIEKMVKEKAREITLKGKRVDGRKTDEIRKLSSQVGVLPRTHGSAIFQRGQTQVLSVTTLGAPSMEQLLESAEGEESKRYIHHYSMPPYSVGQTGRVGYPSRREIGHGALAERAMAPVLPPADKFPYTIRVVSEVTSSNGSTSMASVCGSTLSLMDAGVPIAFPVSGIAMGLVIEDAKKYVVLSDIMGLEDYMVGDMDFKVAGTEKGITAMQLDVKTLNLSTEILAKALDQAKEGRAQILKSILETLDEPRKKVSTFAPKIKVVKIPPEKIGEIIGPGGKMIRKIIAETGAQVEVEDDGSVNISGMTEEAVDAAVVKIEGLTKEVVAGEIYEGEVKRIQPFGAFVEILPGKDGLVHVSDMGEGFVKNPEDVVKLGDKFKVRVKEVDNLGRINLSMNMDPAKDKPRERREGFSGGSRSFGPRPRRDFGSRPSSGGPHFPTSRFIDQKKKSF
jgi:polyribonucleotide nucleotidyltransferase